MKESALSANQIQRHVFFILAGTAIFILKPHFHVPLAQVFHDYGGNAAVSFALYFLAAIAVSRLGLGRRAAAGAALLVVEAFEMMDGFAIMANVMDPLDLLANAAGIGLALAVDFLLTVRNSPGPGLGRPALRRSE